MSAKRFDRNNLGLSRSPYLLQHADNPVWWQEWRSETVDEAARRGVPIFVSSGYATCHWCHVMAAGAFSDQFTADMLNRNFVCVKVDREERPDIDHYLMEFINMQNGSGGWPLNAFITPYLRPFFAFTYLPAETERGMPGLHEVAVQVAEYYRDQGAAVKAFQPSRGLPEKREPQDLVPELLRMFDTRYGGFGVHQKFPPHCTLLYLLYSLLADDSTDAQTICRKTLDAIRLGGLHDHLQGGIFRYCVDREWKIPHFEKMLYDQAMALWCFSLGSKAFAADGKTYRDMALNIVRCLEECFEVDGLFLSAFDADTGHEEGATYLWDHSDLGEILKQDDFEAMKEVYEIEPGGNFEGRIHLVKKIDRSLPLIDEKLLKTRRKRQQPQADTKILCGNNALTVIALLQAGRLLGVDEYTGKAGRTMGRLLDLFWDGKRLAHSFSGEVLQEQSFLSDAAPVAAALAMLADVDPGWRSRMEKMLEYMETFKDPDGWVESRPDDFHHVPAGVFDHPVPSSTAMAEFAKASCAFVMGALAESADFRQPFTADFFNVTAILRRGRS